MESKTKSFQDMIKEGKERTEKLLKETEDQGEKLKEDLNIVGERGQVIGFIVEEKLSYFLNQNNYNQYSSKLKCIQENCFNLSIDSFASKPMLDIINYIVSASIAELEDYISNRIEAGNRVDILMEPREDTDLYEWLMENQGKPLIVTNVEYDTGMIWLEGCEYGVDMQFVVKVYKQ